MDHRLGRRAVRIVLGALAGLLAAGTAIGVGELVAAFLRPVAAPVIAVGNKFILLTPEPLKEFAVKRFGANDKQVLLLGIYAMIAALAIVVGLVALRWLRVGIVGLLGFGAIGVYAAATANASRPSDVVPTIVGTAAAVVVLVVLARALGRPAGRRVAAAAQDTAAPDPQPVPDRQPAAPDGQQPGLDRRVFIAGSVAATALAAGSGFGGRALQHARFDASRSRAAVTLPKPASPAPPLPRGVELNQVPTSFVTANKDFYRVDTALAIPQLSADTWRLRIHGKLDRELVLSFDDLLSRPLIERHITMTCVSNPVGGSYLGTAKFLGVRLADLLAEAGVHADADQIVGRSSDGMTIGTPTAVIMDGRDAMLAVGMNDEPLPIQHGFPVRMLVPGLYGYVSATKWLVDLQATTFADFDTYWVQRRWAAQAPIRLESRIDTPTPFASVSKGQLVRIGGVAWHQHTGIKTVQVQINDGPWREAVLGRVPSTDTWVQWTLPWTVDAQGPVSLRVRAIDNNGVMQDQTRREPFPSGASGWHTVVVQAG